MKLLLTFTAIALLAGAAEPRSLTDEEKITLLQADLKLAQMTNALLDSLLYQNYIQAKNARSAAWADVEQKVGCTITSELKCAPPAAAPTKEEKK